MGDLYEAYRQFSHRTHGNWKGLIETFVDSTTSPYEVRFRKNQASARQISMSARIPALVLYDIADKMIVDSRIKDCMLNYVIQMLKEIKDVDIQRNKLKTGVNK
jgi:hypothetical protein